MMSNIDINMRSAKLPAAALRKILVPTATAIVSSSVDPFLILLGQSDKHAKPVLPGGKIDRADLSLSDPSAAPKICIIRELREELNLAHCTPKHFLTWSDEERDQRVITRASLIGTVAELVVKDLPDSEIVLASFGNPDYVFTVSVGSDKVYPTEELKKITWVDSRRIREGDLSAGHGALVAKYLYSLGLVG